MTTVQQIKSIRSYTGEGYKNFNRSLRDTDIVETSDDMINYINMWNYLSNHRTIKDRIVYRGVPADDYEMFKSFGHINTTFLSTSMSENVALDFLGDHTCCMLVIRLPTHSRASKLQKISNFPDEKEILLAPGILIYEDKKTKTITKKDGKKINIIYYHCTYQNVDTTDVLWFYDQIIKQESQCQNTINRQADHDQLPSDKTKSIFYCLPCKQHVCLYCVKNHISHKPKFHKQNIIQKLENQEEAYGIVQIDYVDININDLDDDDLDDDLPAYPDYDDDDDDDEDDEDDGDVKKNKKISLDFGKPRKAKKSVKKTKKIKRLKNR